MKDSILAKLEIIHTLEMEIEERIIQGLTPVYDETGEALTKNNIQQRIETLADKLMADSSLKNPLLISVMDGALTFTADLYNILAEKKYRFQPATIFVSSYEGTSSSTLTIKAPPKIQVGGRDIVIVDDVCDTGKTYMALRKLLLRQGANSVKLIALVDKAQPRESLDANPTYSGVTISKDTFIAGTGMDFDGLLRTVQGIWGVDLSTLPTREEKLILAEKTMLNEQLQQCIADEQQVSPGHSSDALFAANRARSVAQNDSQLMQPAGML